MRFGNRAASPDRMSPALHLAFVRARGAPPGLGNSLANGVAAPFLPIDESPRATSSPPPYAARKPTMRSLLFVPADSPKKFARGNDERRRRLDHRPSDSVAPDNKARARETALAFLKDASTGSGPPLPRRSKWNSLGGGLTDPDLDAVALGRPDAIMLPKAEGGASSSMLTPSSRCARPQTACLTAISRSFRSPPSRGVAFCRRRLCRLEYAAVRADLGRRRSVRRARRRNRSRCRRPIPRSVPAGAHALHRRRGFCPGAGNGHASYIDFRDDAGFRRDCEAARRDGFSARMAIHPAQIPISMRCSRPRPRQSRKPK